MRFQPISTNSIAAVLRLSCRLAARLLASGPAHCHTAAAEVQQCHDESGCIHLTAAMEEATAAAGNTAGPQGPAGTTGATAVVTLRVRGSTALRNPPWLRGRPRPLSCKTIVDEARRQSRIKQHRHSRMYVYPSDKRYSLLLLKLCFMDCGRCLRPVTDPRIEIEAQPR